MRRVPLGPPLNPPLIPLYRIAISYPAGTEYEQQRHRTGRSPSHTYTSNIVPEQLAERGLFQSQSQSQSSLLKIYFRVSGFQSSFLLIHFRYRTECLITLQQSVAQNLSDMWRSTFQRRRVAFLRYRNRAEKLLPFLCVNRIPVRFDFKRRAGARAVWYSENRPLGKLRPLPKKTKSYKVKLMLMLKNS